MKPSLVSVLAALTLLGCSQNKTMNIQNLTQEWDKTFPKSERVRHSKISFHNRYGIDLVADMYVPLDAEGKLPAIAVSGPFGAVKEQTSGLYAQHMAERGFLTIAFDPSFTGESGGEPRRMASPDINTEDFLAAVDYLSTQELVDPERIGIIGICGFGDMAINAAALDPRIKATVTSTMYDMSRVTREGYSAARTAKKPATRSAKPGRPSGLRTIARVPTSAPAAWWIRFRMMLPGLSKTTIPTTKRPVATTSAAAIPMTVGTSPAPSLS